MLLTEEFVGGRKGDTRFPLGWPKTYLMLGAKDCVREESLLFMQKMEESNIAFKCLLYECLGHGFLVM